MGSGLDDAEIHEVAAPDHLSTDLSELLASGLPRASNEVLVSGLDVVVDRDTVEKHVLCRVDEELLGVEEGVAHFLELGDIVGADLLAVLHGGADSGDEVAELVNTGGNLVEGAGLEVLHGGGHVAGEGVDILDASLEAGNVLGLECTNEDSVDQLDNVLSDFKFTSNVVFGALACIGARDGISMAARGSDLAEGCSDEKS